MLYLNKDSGSAISEVLSSLQGKISKVEIRLTEDCLLTSISVKECRNNRKSCNSEPVRGDSKADKRRKNAKYINYDGKTLSVAEWSKMLKVGKNTVRYRMDHCGNPYGRKGPTDKDKIIAGM